MVKTVGRMMASTATIADVRSFEGGFESWLAAENARQNRIPSSVEVICEFSFAGSFLWFHRAVW
jgi:hypothetical protein